MEEERVWGGRNRGRILVKNVTKMSALSQSLLHLGLLRETLLPSQGRTPLSSVLPASQSSQGGFKGWWRWESPGYWCSIQVTWHCPSLAWFPSSSLKSFPEVWVIWKSPEAWSQPRKYWKIDPNGRRRWKRWREETVWAEGQRVDSMHKDRLV